jgi:hypothetical protein
MIFWFIMLIIKNWKENCIGQQGVPSIHAFGQCKRWAYIKIADYAHVKVACRAFEPNINNTGGGKHGAIVLTYRAAAMEAGTYQRQSDQRTVREMAWKQVQGGEIESSLDFGNLWVEEDIWQLSIFKELRSYFTKLLEEVFFSFLLKY